MVDAAAIVVAALAWAYAFYRVARLKFELDQRVAEKRDADAFADLKSHVESLRAESLTDNAIRMRQAHNLDVLTKTVKELQDQLNKATMAMATSRR